MKNKKIIILGGSGIGMMAANIAEENGHEVIGFLNNEKNKYVGKYKKHRVVGDLNKIKKFLKYKDVFFSLAFKTMKKERLMWEQYLKLNIPINKFITLIHQSAYVPNRYSKIGKGVIICANASVGVDVRIGNNSILMPFSYVGHNSVLKKYVTLANHASIGARVIIGNAAHVGSNSTIKQGVRIGEFSIIGNSTNVLKNVKPDTIYFNKIK